MKRILIPAFAALAAMLPAYAQNTSGLAPKTQEDYDKVVRPDEKTTLDRWDVWFNLPSGFDAWSTASFEEKGLTFTYECSNPELLEVDNCGYNAAASFNNNNLTWHLKKMTTGEATLTVTAHYGDETATATRRFIVSDLPDYTFEPCEATIYTLSGTRSAAEKTIQVYMSNFFKLPDGWSDASTWAENGITWGCEADNSNVFSSIVCDIYNTTYPRISLTAQPVTGQTRLTFWVERNGVRSESVYTSDFYAVRNADDEAYFQIGEGAESDIDILKNDNLMTGYTVDIEIVSAPAKGEAEILDNPSGWGAKKKKAHYKLTADPTGITNYSTDSFRYRTVLRDTDGTEIESSEADVKVVLRNNPFISKTFGMVAAPGQFTNASYYDPTVLIGTGGTTGTSSTPSTSGLISLGSFGGYVVFGCESPILNDPRNPYGIDFTLVGNPMKGNRYGYWIEPGAVMVSRDDNGNGLPDDPWYELAGSDYWFSTTRRNATFTYEDPGYSSRHAVVFTDDLGRTGAVNTNYFHAQNYFPEKNIYPGADISDGKIAFTGTLIACNYDLRNPAYIEAYRPLAFGYTDNHVTKGDLTVPVNPYSEETLADGTVTTPGDGFDISWAVDGNGNYVDLDQIDFIKVYNPVWQNCGASVGESSTEVGAFAITRPDFSQTAPGDYYLNYADTHQLVFRLGETHKFEGVAFHNGRLMQGLSASWSIDDPAVGTIDSDGNFTALAVGNTHIRFQATAEAPEDVIEIEVVELDGIALLSEGASLTSASKLSMLTGDKIWIDAQTSFSAGSSIALYGTSANRYTFDSYTWESSDPTVATVDEYGTITATGMGETHITVTSQANPGITTGFDIEVIATPEVTKTNKYLVIEDSRMTQEQLNAKTFSNSDVFSCKYTSNKITFAKTLTLTGIEVEPAEYAESFYIENNKICNRLTLGDYREYMLTLTAELDGEETTFSLPLLHTTSYNTVMPPTVKEDAILSVSTKDKRGELDLAEVFVVEGYADIYTAKYRLASSNSLPDDVTVTIEDGILVLTYTVDEMPEVEQIVVEGYVSRATQKNAPARQENAGTTAAVPEYPAWKSATIKVDAVTTGVEEIETTATEGVATEEYYTLEGLRLDRRPSQKGIYIHRRNNKSTKLRY